MPGPGGPACGYGVAWLLCPGKLLSGSSPLLVTVGAAENGAMYSFGSQTRDPLPHLSPEWESSLHPLNTMDVPHMILCQLCWATDLRWFP